MEYPCYKCGQSIEEGKPFCAQCGAPQIRVAIPEPLVSAMATDVAPGAVPVFSLNSGVVRPPMKASAISTGIDWPHSLRACTVSAIIAAFVMALGLAVPLLAALGAGSLAVVLYHRRSAGIITARSGAQIGALCGLLFFGISAIFETIAVAVFHTGGELRQKILDALQQAATRSADPQVQAAFERLRSPEGLAMMMVLGMIVLFFISLAAGGVAGALTGALLGQRKQP